MNGPRRILLDATAARGDLTGVGWSMVETVRALGERDDPDLEIHVAAAAFALMAAVCGTASISRRWSTGLRNRARSSTPERTLDVPQVGPAYPSPRQ